MIVIENIEFKPFMLGFKPGADCLELYSGPEYTTDRIKIAREVISNIQDYILENEDDQVRDAILEYRIEDLDDSLERLTQALMERLYDSLEESCDPAGENYKGLNDCGVFDTATRAQIRHRILICLKEYAK